MEKNLEKNIKRYLKRKTKITLGFVVSFLITGAVGYAEVINFEKTAKNNNLDNNDIIQEIIIKDNETVTINNTGIILGSNLSEITNSGTINVLNNAGIISGKSNKQYGYGIYNIGKIISLNNQGIISENTIELAMGIWNKELTSQIDELNNLGIITANSSKKYGYAINNYGTIFTLNNSGMIFGNSNENLGYGIYINGDINTLNNNGAISRNSNKDYGYGIYNLKTITDFDNNGIISGNSAESNGCGIVNTYGKIITLDNNGIIFGYGTTSGYGGIRNARKITSLHNNGIIFGKTSAVFNNAGKIETFDNFGLLANKDINKYIVDRTDVTNYGLMFTAKDDGTYEIDSSTQTHSSDKVINAKLTSDAKGTESISVDNYNDKYINGITDTLKVEKDAEIKNSVINGYTNAVVFAEGEHSLTLTGTTVNGGLSNISDTENSLGIAILGSESKDKLTLSNESIVNGNINLGAGDDILSLDSTVQINGNLNGGEGKDNLTFTSSLIKSSEEKNINILYDITGFENTTVDTKVTLFEKTITDKGDIKNLSAQLGDITIKENGELVLRVDGTEKDTVGKVTGHALYENKGSITAEDGGKLTLNSIGFGEVEVIDFKDTDLSNLKDEDIKLSSVLHKGKIEEDNTITVSAKKDLEDLDITNYDKLNKIYHSIVKSENLDKFTVEEEQYGAFTKYLHDIYAGNPYAYSSELSRKTMGIMRNLADKDLKPEINKWAVYGGLTHIDGGTENSYYGKGYYTYDIGSRDISADTKINGGYFKAEYGKSDTTITGIIFGGNNSETEIGASKVEGDSFYFGAYAKKYLNNFRFTLGAGFKHGDYKADRTAVGYDEITETRKYDSNYHDRGFDIYGDIKYSKEIGNNFFFEPSFTLSYTYLDQDGAKDEKGVLAIETDSKNFEYSSGEINLDLRKEIKSDKFTHSFTAGVSYERMLSGYDEEYISGRIKGENKKGTDFDILVPEKEKDIFSLNAKYELETEKGILFDVKGSYRFEHDSNQNEWIIGTGIGYRF